MSLILISALYLLQSGFATTKRDYIVALWHLQRNMTWIQANDYCEQTYDSTLATMLTFDDLHLAYNYSYYGGFIGLNDIDEDNQWTWIDGTECQVTNINNSAICTDFYIPNRFVNDSLCSRIPIHGRAITDIECDDYYAQLFCNKIRGYIYESSSMSQPDAEKYCQNEYGTHLATITENDISNLDVIPTSVGFVSYWIGLVTINSTLRWLDGTQFDHDINLLEINATSTCNSLIPDDQVIHGEHECDEMLPFLCNKRPKPREYIIHKENVTFDKAQAICQEMHGTGLATVITEEEFSEVVRILPEFEAAWVGLRQVNDTFIWIDGTNCTEQNGLCVPYWNQYDNILDKECGFIYQLGAARSTFCDNRIGLPNFLCNKPVAIFRDAEKWQAGICGFSDSYGNSDVDIPFEYKFAGQAPNVDQSPVQIVYWNVYQDYALENETWSDMYLLFEDLDSFNEDNSTIVGNIVLCADKNNDLCLLIEKIGPSNFEEELKEKFPVKINTNFDLNDILIVRDYKDDVIDYTSGMIRVWAHFYAVYGFDSSKDKIYESIKETIFPNGTDVKQFIFSAESAWIIYTTVYDDFETIYQDIGNPNNWDVRFSDYYFVPILNDLVIYMFGISADFENSTILDEFLKYGRKPITTEPNVTTTIIPTKDTVPTKDEMGVWQIVGIVFIVLFGIALCVIIFLIMYIYNNINNKQRKGYHAAQSHDIEMKNTTAGYNM